MIFTSSQNTAITRTALDGVFYQEFDFDSKEPSIATARTGDLFVPISTEHSAYIHQIFSGVGLFQNTGETASVATSTPKVTNTQTIVVNDFTNGVEISKDLFDDNMWGVWSSVVKDMAIKARASMDTNAFSLFNGAFTTTLTADGVSLINAAHPLIQGGTTTNVIGAALSNTGLNTAIVLLRKQVDQTNVILGNLPYILLVPSELFQFALQLTESALVADTSTNAVNVWRTVYGMKVYSSPYLSSATAWFVLARNHGIRRVIRQGIQTALRSWEYSNNRTYFYQANYRESYFAADYAGIVGSSI